MFCVQHGHVVLLNMGKEKTWRKRGREKEVDCHYRISKFESVESSPVSLIWENFDFDFFFFLLQNDIVQFHNCGKVKGIPQTASKNENIFYIEKWQ